MDERTYRSNSRCTYEYSDGESCTRSALEDERRCFWHLEKSGKKVPESTETENVRLDGAYLVEAEITGRSFDQSSLEGVNLSDALIERCSFEQTTLRYTNVSGAVLVDCTFNDATLLEVDGVSSRIHESVFSEVESTDSSFTGAAFDGCRIDDSDITGADFCETAFRECELEDVLLADTIATKSTFNTVNLRDSRLHDVDFEESYFPECDLSNSKITDCDFRQADLPTTTLDDVSLLHASFVDAHLSSSSIRDADCLDVDFSDATLDNSDCTNTRFEKCDFTEATAIEVNFRNAGFHNAKLVWTSMADSDLSGATLERSNCTITDFRGVDLSQSRLYSATFSDVQVDETTVLSNPHHYGESADGFKKTISVYRTLEQVARANGLLEIASSLRLYRKQVERKASFWNATDNSNSLEIRLDAYSDWIFLTLSSFVTGHGERPSRVLVSAINTIIVFGLLYPIVGGFIYSTGEYRAIYFADLTGVALSKVNEVVVSSLVYSVATFSTFGVSYMQPATLTGRALASVESVLGLLHIVLFAVVIAQASNRY